MSQEIGEGRTPVPLSTTRGRSYSAIFFARVCKSVEINGVRQLAKHSQLYAMM